LGIYQEKYCCDRRGYCCQNWQCWFLDELENECQHKTSYIRKKNKVDCGLIHWEWKKTIWKNSTDAPCQKNAKKIDAWAKKEVHYAIFQQSFSKLGDATPISWPSFFNSCEALAIGKTKCSFRTISSYFLQLFWVVMQLLYAGFSRELGQNFLKLKA